MEQSLLLLPGLPVPLSISLSLCFFYCITYIFYFKIKGQKSDVFVEAVPGMSGAYHSGKES